MTLTIIDDIKKIALDVKEWFLENGSNPFVWVGIILVGLLLFEIIFKSLNERN